ncbi:hypothetical protein GRS48_12765 [Halorubrum sp. JWXQ-INN 858]|uniref:DUF7096 domain-containing protein n=1 Tax=Halorubrum sp. JWXQ-INN 858 TaxID=2690782 RepID=UPI0013576006|nr:hypothetical protein [Halorubrum sp. JWXQ-INN 858]MWV65684.1 hypothetical protein [Halorubrum sp. JWXQ-INN 858]
MRALPVLVALFMVLAPIAGAVTAAPPASDPTVDAADAVNAFDAVDAVDADVQHLQPTDTVAQTGDGGDTSGDDTNGDEPAENDENDTDGESADDGSDANGEPEVTFRVLSTPPDADPRAGVHGHDANLGTSLGLEVGEVDAALETEAVVQRIEDAETTAERQRRILAAVNQVEQDEVSLHSRQISAVDAHAAGELSDRELLAELVAVAAVAREYDARLDVLDELAEGTEGFSSPSRLDELQVQLQVYEGPVRDRALATLRGETGGSEVHVESSGGALVLATIDESEGQYVREAFRNDRWDRGGGTISSEDAINATVASYPETTALREPDAFGAGAVQRITVSHEFGELRTFVSGGTDQVFVEYQRTDLETFPDYETVTTTEDGFNVTVDRSYPGGPVVVTVLDDEDGDPVTGVTVTKSVSGGDSEAIGATDGDGAVVTLSPTGTYRINVVDEPRVAVIDGLEPTELPRLVDDRVDEGSDEE